MDIEGAAYDSAVTSSALEATRRIGSDAAPGAEAVNEAMAAVFYNEAIDRPDDIGTVHRDHQSADRAKGRFGDVKHAERGRLGARCIPNAEKMRLITRLNGSTAEGADVRTIPAFVQPGILADDEDEVPRLGGRAQGRNDRNAGSA
jgi:hypothetical protein